jgi:hypothetical protein
VRFTDPRFLFIFLPIVFALYFPLRTAERQRTRVGAWAAGSSAGLLLAASLVLVAGVGVLTALGGGRVVPQRTIVPLGLAVIVCHAIAYSVDIRRGEADRGRWLVAALYLVQFPLLAAGPIVRHRDFSAQLARRADGMGAFAYGARRIVTGLVKVVLIANTLAVPADRIFALPPAKLTADAAWLAAICFSMQIYFLFGGYADMAIGLGRMLGFRYPENFRRPYTADSVREFWRRWNITLIIWLRDYLYLPIAGQDRPTPRLYLNIVAGFCIVGLWHGAGVNGSTVGCVLRQPARTRGRRPRRPDGAMAGGCPPSLRAPGRDDRVGDSARRDGGWRAELPDSDGGAGGCCGTGDGAGPDAAAVDRSRGGGRRRGAARSLDQPLARVGRCGHDVAADDDGGDERVHLASRRNRDALALAGRAIVNVGCHHR